MAECSTGSLLLCAPAGAAVEARQGEWVRRRGVCGKLRGMLAAPHQRDNEAACCLSTWECRSLDADSREPSA